MLRIWSPTWNTSYFNVYLFSLRILFTSTLIVLSVIHLLRPVGRLYFLSAFITSDRIVY